MSLETDGGSAEVTETVSAESLSGSATSESKIGYSVTDPGYTDDSETESAADQLAALKAENTKETPPPETSGDASDTDGETEETTDAQSTDEAADSTEISDELLDRAAALGYTVGEIKGFQSKESLENEVSRVEKLQQRMQERQAGIPPANDEPAPVEEADPEPDWDALIEEGHDPDMVALQKKSYQRAAQAEAMVKQMHQAEQARVFDAQCERFDETLNKLDGFEKILGNGRKGELEKASPNHAANRQKVFTTMQILKRGYEEAGVNAPAEAELIQAAAMASFPQHVQQTARDRLKNDIKKAGSQSLSRPHSTGAKPLAGAPLAAAKEDAFWKKFR